MRTTISIEDSLLQKAKKIAHERRISLREVIEDALRAAFARGRKDDPVQLAPPVEDVQRYRDSTRDRPQFVVSDTGCDGVAMILLDVNVLVTAHREDAEHHHEIKSWLESALRERRE